MENKKGDLRVAFFHVVTFTCLAISSHCLIILLDVIYEACLR